RHRLYAVDRARAGAMLLAISADSAARVSLLFAIQAVATLLVRELFVYQLRGRSISARPRHALTLDRHSAVRAGRLRVFLRGMDARSQYRGLGRLDRRIAIRGKRTRSR